MTMVRRRPRFNVSMRGRRSARSGDCAATSRPSASSGIPTSGSSGQAGDRRIAL